MPFGVLYSALFFGLVSFWLVGSDLQAGASIPLAARIFVALAGFSLSLGLLLRRNWARWTGVAFSIFLVALVLVALAGRGGSTELVVLFGAIAATGLLMVPATGDPNREAGDRALPAPGLGRLAGVSTIVGILGLSVGLWWPGGSDAADTRAGTALPASARMPDRVQWADFDTGKLRASDLGAPMMVTFVTDWCGYCRKMDRTTWKDAAVVERLGDVVAVRVNAEGPEGGQVAARYGVQGFPTQMLLDAEGRVLARSSGYLEAGQFLRWLDAAISRVPGTVAGTAS